MSLGLGNSEYDMLNYHFYSPFALLTNRIGYDIFPAGVRSYFNPIADIPFYYLVKYFNNYPYFIAFIQGLYYGFFCFVVYLLSKLYFRSKFLCCLSVFFAGSSMLLLAMTGCSFIDIQLSALILLGFYFLVKNIHQEKNFIFSGLSMGIALGLKLAFFPYILAVLFILFILRKKIGFKNIITFLISFSIPFLLLGGSWMAYIWIKFHNPFFPCFNGVFNSEYYSTNTVYSQIYDEYKDKSAILNFLKFPIKFSKSGLWNNWMFYNLTDFKFLTACICSVLFIFFKKGFRSKFLVAFWLISYILCVVSFSYYRFFIPLLGLSGIIVLKSCSAIFQKYHKENYFKPFIIVLFVLLTVTLSFPLYPERDRASTKFLFVNDAHIESNSLVLLGSESTSFIIPFQNPKARYVNMIIPKDIKLEKTCWEPVFYVYSDYYEKRIREYAKFAPHVYFIYRASNTLVDRSLYEKCLNFYGVNIDFTKSTYIAEVPGGHIFYIVKLK